MKSFILFLLCIISVSNAWSQQIITLFVHGIADSAKQAIPFTKAHNRPYVVEGHVASFNFKCSTHHWWRMNVPHCSLGQDNELEQLNHEWKKLNQQFPHADGFVLIGISRGAAAIINFVATYKPKKIKALILESPFDSIDTVAQHISESRGIPINMVKAAIKAICWRFDPKGICPAKVIDEIKEDIPILFVTVKKDHLMPKRCCKNLMQARRQQGHQNCYHLHLAQGKHGNLMKGNDAIIYQNVAHAFFATHNLPHNSALAQEGNQIFTTLNKT